jgi:hypothetical protein
LKTKAIVKFVEIIDLWIGIVQNISWREALFPALAVRYLFIRRGLWT